MSTKNLARTVIEGGRSALAHWTRDADNCAYRRGVRTRLAGLRDEAAMEDLAFSTPKRTHRYFDDKLGPAQRWLASQVGRPWDKVRGELFQRFDTRTTAGRHIVFCHMLGWVAENDTVAAASWRVHFRVDRHGILRHAPARPRYVWSGWRPPLPRDRAELERWLDGRRVGARADVLFWFLLTPGNAYRQHHRLDEEDVALWRSLPEWFREQNDPAAPPPALPQNRN